MSPLPAPGFTSNFTSAYSVLIDHPIEAVFSIIGTSKGCERTTLASSLCCEVKLLERDTISVPNSLVLAEYSVRQKLAVDGEQEEGNRLLPRQHLTLRERVSILGPIRTSVEIRATLTWDEQAKTALYESVAGSILIWKLREFKEEEDGTKTRITECIRGKCPGWLQSYVSGVTARYQKEHMDKFHSLFETSDN